mmetsp:Transcript_8503/g.7542  ORF Transcript_8503/g.7542 Transcript_8503/m.7542 type:complete len:82 (-) Transcript_8503:108-353(-)|eukprot:CAMPEP_0114578942 /NCGR_PEP_ID=MMETSP0125-20121206/3412_1 /TAXON_ID=485358 ORGANISM="Aristerostoma sp., Strain ATCC 50986" /NCGR_SAMPLE_ID=MMETSP0125 /ASSEMBLY_ACC=CAM_ASM_000245 /LENGTH=81 /DNA_ID=CAMNT_0001769377 /DNA_START=1404 /DNA_END=1649 /DNA_ORIENTATION=-
MVEQAFRLTIDPLFPPPQNWPNPKKGMMVDNLFENNKWELIFDEIEDGPALKSLQQNDGQFTFDIEEEDDDELHSDDGGDI